MGPGLAAGPWCGTAAVPCGLGAMGTAAVRPPPLPPPPPMPPAGGLEQLCREGQELVNVEEVYRDGQEVINEDPATYSQIKPPTEEQWTKIEEFGTKRMVLPGTLANISVEKNQEHRGPDSGDG